MSEPFIAEIRIFAGNFAPRGWAYCDGQLLPISNNTALFSLIGTTYGGDGRSTMALPDLRARAPMQPGHGPGLTARRLGERTGTENVTLTEAEMPQHGHTIRAQSGIGSVAAPGGTVSFARASFGDNLYQTDPQSNVVDLSTESIRPAGRGQSHTNMQPYLVMTFIIALVGIYPSRG